MYKYIIYYQQYFKKRMKTQIKINKKKVKKG